MSETMISHIRELQKRLAKAEGERNAAIEALRPFAEAWRVADRIGYHALAIVGPSVEIIPEHFARAAELVPPTSAPPSSPAAPHAT